MRKIAVALSTLALAGSLAACADRSGDAQANGGGGTEFAQNIAALAKQVGDKTAESDTAHMVFTGGAGGAQVKGEGDIKVGGDNPAISMDIDAGDVGDMSIVLLDGVLYIKVPADLGSGGKTWFKIDSKDKNNPMAQALGDLTNQLRQNADPRQALEQFQDAGTITSTKKETLNGQETTHYKITVDVRKLAANQQDPTLKDALEEGAKAGLKDFPVELWVDGDNLPVRMTVSMPANNPASGKAEPVEVQVDYSKWGEPVDIQAPPADQVGEFPR